MAEARKNLSDLVLVVGGKVASVAVVFAGGAIVARFGGPAEYGLFATALALILLLDGMIGSPLDMGAVRFSSLHPDEEPRTRRFEAMSLQIKLLTLALVMGGWLLWCLRDADGSLPRNLLVTLVVAALLAARSSATGLQSRQRFMAYSLVDIGQGCFRLAAFAGLAFLGLSQTTPFLIAYGVASLLVLATGLTVFRQGYLFGRWPSKPDVWRMFGYCGFAAGVVSLGTLTGRGDLLVLSAWFSPEEVAGYGAASQLFLLLSQLSLYVSVVTQARVLSWFRSGTLRRMFLLNVLVVGLGLIPVLVLHANPDYLTSLIGLVFGAGYEGATGPFRLLMFGGLVDLLLVPVLLIFVLQVHPGRAFAVELAATALFVVVAFLFIPRTSPEAAQLAMAWLAVGIRSFKLLAYLGLFWRSSGPPDLPVAAAA